jgi:RimJ/RimL family protein N-acetyltransferase
MPQVRLEPFDLEADGPRLHRWLAQPAVRRGWGAPGAVLRELRHPHSGMATIGGGTQPVGLIVWQRPADADLAAAGIAGLPEATVDIDLMVGPAHWRGRGVGSAALRVLRDRLMAEGVPLVIYCAEAGNRRSRVAAGRAGFRLRRRFRDPLFGATWLHVARRPADC